MISLRKGNDTLTKNVKLFPIKAFFGKLFETIFKLAYFKFVMQEPLHLKVGWNHVFSIISLALVLLRKPINIAFECLQSLNLKIERRNNYSSNQKHSFNKSSNFTQSIHQVISIPGIPLTLLSKKKVKMIKNIFITISLSDCVL
jgi:hypothetical protein